jgi:predicted DNA-binding transcriptional regulator YafY
MLLALERARIGLTIDRLARKTGVTTRTIRRDLEALQTAGAPLVEDDEHRWRALDWRSEVA